MSGVRLEPMTPEQIRQVWDEFREVAKWYQARPGDQRIQINAAALVAASCFMALGATRRQWIDAAEGAWRDIDSRRRTAALRSAVKPQSMNAEVIRGVFDKREPSDADP